MACTKDRPHPPVHVPLQESWKGLRPFQGWHIDLAGPFPRDEDGNRYLFVAVDPFSKWVEASPMPTKASWRTARALYEVLARWGKPAWVTTDNGTEFMGDFKDLCDALGVMTRRITVGNSRANGQAERVIRTIKDCIRKMQTERPNSFWSDHVPTALVALRFTAHKLLGLPPFVILTGAPAIPPSHLLDEEVGEVETMEGDALDVERYVGWV